MTYLKLEVSCCFMVLTLGLLRFLGKKEIFAEFESLCAQLLDHSATSVEQRTALKANLVNLYCSSIIESHDFTKHKEYFCIINSLQKK